MLKPVGRALGYMPGLGQLTARAMGHDPSKYLEEALPSVATELITAPLIFGADVIQWSDSNLPWSQRFLALGEGASQFIPGEEILLKGGSKLVKRAWNQGKNAVETAKNARFAGVLGKVDAASPVPNMGAIRHDIPASAGPRLLTLP